MTFSGLKRFASFEVWNSSNHVWLRKNYLTLKSFTSTEFLLIHWVKCLSIVEKWFFFYWFCFKSKSAKKIFHSLRKIFRNSWTLSRRSTRTLEVIPQHLPTAQSRFDTVCQSWRIPKESVMSIKSSINICKTSTAGKSSNELMKSFMFFNQY